jgi:hypothetical protein
VGPVAPGLAGLVFAWTVGGRALVYGRRMNGHEMLSEVAFWSDLAAGAPFTVRIEVKAIASRETFGADVYAESGVALPDPQTEPNRVRRYMPIGQVEAVDAASAFAGAASLAASWVERMDRRADGLRLLADHEDELDPAE